MHLKKYRLTNTTNKDVKKFAIRLVFDKGATIIDYSSHTKEGESKSNITLNNGKKNECTLHIINFNRGDKVDITIRIGNISENEYYITEFDSIGFKIHSKDKRKRYGRTVSKFSEALA